MPGRNVYTVLTETAAKYGDAAALHQPTGRKGEPAYRIYSWNEWAKLSTEIALGLRSLGLLKGDIVCLLSETRAEFYLADLGIMAAGGVAAALYTAYPMADLVRNIQASQPRFLFVEDSKALASLRKAAAEQAIKLPEHVMLLTGSEPGSEPGVLTLEAVARMGRELLVREPDAMTRVQQEISLEDGAILYLTSGATGEPKMGITSHAAVVANIDQGPAVLPIAPEDSTIVFLPSAHITQRIALQLLPMRMGTPVWFSESLSRLPAELKAIKPTFFLAPPRVWERMYATILSEVKKRPMIARKIFYGALGLGAEAARYQREDKPLPGWKKTGLSLANKLVFQKVRERLGGRLRIAASGGAPLGKDLAEFYAAIGMPLVEGYGLTEAGIVVFNPLDRPKPGSIGKLLPSVEARLAEDGELQLRSPFAFKGYYRDEAATRLVVDDAGWFSTGDIAETDSSGYWYITGRKKELIVSSNGKKIYPSRIENLFKMEPMVSQVVLVGDKKPYMTALLTVNLANLKGAKVDVSSAAPGQTESVNKIVQEAVARVNKHLADFERIRRFRILDRDFSIEHGELTPTMKIRRARVLENHKELVSQLYLGREESA
jgi:long-chain acyl-CoA synthetase